MTGYKTQQELLNDIADRLINVNDNRKTEISIQVPNIQITILIQELVIYNDVLIITGINAYEKKGVIDSMVFKRGMFKSTDKVYNTIKDKISETFDAIKKKIFKDYDFLSNANIGHISLDVKTIALNADSSEKFSSNIVDDFITIDIMKFTYFNSNNKRFKVSLENAMDHIMRFLVDNRSMMYIDFVDKRHGVTVRFTMQKAILCNKFIVGMEAARIDDGLKEVPEEMNINNSIVDLGTLGFGNYTNRRDLIDTIDNNIDSVAEDISIALSKCVSFITKVSDEYDVYISYIENNNNENYV